MDIQTISLTHSAISSFKEKFTRSLTDQEKKILIIGSIALGCVALAYYAVNHYYFKAKKMDDEEEIDSPQVGNIKQLDTDTEQKRSLGKIASFLKNDFSQLKSAQIQIHSAKSFIKIDFEQGEIKKEFIIRNVANPLIDDDFMAQQADKIKQSLENEINANLGAYKKLQFITLFMCDKHRLHKKGHDETFFNKNHQIQGNSEIPNMSHLDIAATYRIIIDQMGFPKESQMKDKEFVPGTFYQALD